MEHTGKVYHEKKEFKMYLESELYLLINNKGNLHAS